MKDDMGYFKMCAQGLPMIDEMGMPIKLDEQVILLVPIMEMDGKIPQMEPETGEPRMYP